MLEIFVPVYNFLTICEVVQLDFNTLALSGNSEIYKKKYRYALMLITLHCRRVIE